ncbi:MAG: phosphatidate cytidylyltransferase [Alphaproteobacteria bacterium]|nr:phosphatidate cytidylyltransferase [Alphaproteobacteria bacterium]NNF23998.1 phosphatidate cytidylyltransferase [Paracoccaceae bacterium]
MSAGADDLTLIIGGVLGLLLLATLIGEALRMRGVASRQTLDIYITRVNSWWVMAVTLSVALLLGKVVTLMLFAFCSFAALREFMTLTHKTRADHWALVASFYVVLPVQYVLVWWGQEGLFTSFIPVYAFLLLPILSMMRGAGASFLARISETQWALMICVFCASHVPALLVIDLGEYSARSVLLIAFLVLVVQLGDLMVYFAGRRIGRHRVAPSISPKSWEGVACGAVFAALIGASVAWITPFGTAGAALMALISFLIGTGGALVLDAIKKDRGVTNWGHIIPGQGGIVDQLDSVFFAAPVFFYVTRFFWA